MKPTLSQLEKTWWWRKSNAVWTFETETTMTRAVKPERVYKAGIWKGGMETAAFAWELARRHPDAPDLPPFPKLSDLLALELVARFGKSEIAWIEESGDAMKSQAGYSMPAVWPLHLPDYTLEIRFREFIAEQRAEQGITAKKGRASESSQGPRWRWVELLDLARNAIRAKSTLAHGRDFDKRRHMEARARCKATWLELQTSGLLQTYLAK
jgi:hypothetical protein